MTRVQTCALPICIKLGVGKAGNTTVVGICYHVMVVHTTGIPLAKKNTSLSTLLLSGCYPQRPHAQVRRHGHMELSPAMSHSRSDAGGASVHGAIETGIELECLTAGAFAVAGPQVTDPKARNVMALKRSKRTLRPSRTPFNV